MSIKYIEAISIDGKGNSPNRKLFNGYIYRLNYDISFGDGKSKVITNLGSEDGTFSIAQSDLNYSRIYPIKIGSNINVNMFLTRVRKIVEPLSKMLELEFSDTSTKLDTYFVGLKTKHGMESQKNLIIVGREVHPCDRDYTGDIDDLEQIENECHPCRNTAIADARKEIVNCKEITKYSILDVVYNFSMLKKALIESGINIQNVQDPNPEYFARHTGKVREVLKNWCEDFGWAFYWEDEQVKFIDLRKNIDVAASVAQFCPNLSAYEEEWSVEDTFVTKSISLYERAGSNEEFNCEDAKYLVLPPYEPGSAGVGEDLAITNKIKKIPAGLSLYSKTLRDLYYAFDYYSLRSAGDYTKGKFMPKIGLKIVSDPITLTGQITGGSGGGLEPSGGLEGGSLEPSAGMYAPTYMPLKPEDSQSMSFLDSYTTNNKLLAVKALINSNAKYKMCFQLLSEEDQWVVANGLAKDKEDFFFFVGYYDETLDEGHFEEERQFASEFLGRYHVYSPDMNNPLDAMFFEDTTFKEQTICNQNIRLNDVEVTYNALSIGAGDNLRFINNPGSSSTGQPDTLSSLPFFKWLNIARNSNEASIAPDKNILFKLLIIEKSDAQFYPSPSTAQDIDPEDIEKPKDAIKNTELIQEAQKNAIIRLERKNNAYGEFIPRKVTDNSIDKTLDRSKVFIFLGRKVGRDDYRVVTSNAFNNANLIGTPFDGRPLYFSYGGITNTFEDKDGEVFYQYPEFKCQPVGNFDNYCFKRSFKTPVGVFTYYEPTYSIYGTVLQKTKTIKRRNEKIQNIFYFGNEVNPQTARLDVNFRNISDDDINDYQNTPNNQCRYNLDKIRKLHERFAKNINLEQSKPSVKKTFTVEGIDILGKPKIADGLLSISIGLDQDGVRTTYQFGNVTARPRAEGLLKSEDLTKLYTEAYDLPIAPRTSNTF